MLDLVMDPADLALWPGASVHVGSGLWRSMPTGWWFAELAVIAGFCVYYWQRSRVDRSFGGRAATVIVVILL